MAERIVSPGVFTREKDLSFLPQGVADIGAAIIGPTKKGPAFVPTMISNFSEFEEMFGELDKNYYTPYTVQQYLRSAGTVTVVRVLGIGGYEQDAIEIIGYTGHGRPLTLAVLAPSVGGVEGTADLSSTIVSGSWSTSAGVRIKVAGDNITTYEKYVSFATSSADYIGKVFSRDPKIKTDGGTTVPVYLYKLNDGINSHTGSGGWAASNAGSFGAKATGSIQISNLQGANAQAAETLQVHLNSNASKKFFTAVTLNDGETMAETYKDNNPNYYYEWNTTAADHLTNLGNKIQDVYQGDLNVNTGASTHLAVTASNIGTNANSWTFTSGSTEQAISDKSSVDLTLAGGLLAHNNITGSQITLDLRDGSTSYNSDGTAGTWTGNADYCAARTPYVQSQKISGKRMNLFRVYTRSHGTDMNSKFRVGISNVKAASAVAGSDYGTFTLSLFKHAPGKSDDGTQLDSWDELTFDPESTNYFARRIGDRHVTIDSNGKLTYLGEWPNLSKHIRVGDYPNLEGLPKTVVPMGHQVIQQPFTNMPSASFVDSQINRTTDEFDSNIYYGFDFDKSRRPDNMEYLSPIARAAGIGSNVSMSLEDMTGHADASSLGGTYTSGSQKITLSNSAIQQRKFLVPFQWGFDGDNPGTPLKTGTDISATNTMGFDCSSATTTGSVVYRRAINAISNPDEFDINLLATPGIIHRLHPKVTNHAISKLEARADAFYVMDAAAYGDTIATTTNTVSSMDTNYAATYYPWVKIVDSDTNLPVWVPPSVVLPGVIAFTDKVAHEWFAPAGLNRGGLTTVLEAKTRLTHAERDQLYEDRVNPIATFPGQGVVVFGQKTLQAKPSALDRINVRRLLIALKKFIASASRYLVFEQNTVATRNRFLNIVNPYLESVQSNSGLSAFRVVMDDTNNTPDVVDRNRLVGQIFIQPTRTAEFIVLDFIVQPTGAAFPE